MKITFKLEPLLRFLDTMLLVQKQELGTFTVVTSPEDNRALFWFTENVGGVECSWCFQVPAICEHVIEATFTPTAKFVQELHKGGTENIKAALVNVNGVSFPADEGTQAMIVFGEETDDFNPFLVGTYTDDECKPWIDEAFNRDCYDLVPNVYYNALYTDLAFLVREGDTSEYIFFHDVLVETDEDTFDCEGIIGPFESFFPNVSAKAYAEELASVLPAPIPEEVEEERKETVAEPKEAKEGPEPVIFGDSSAIIAAKDSLEDAEQALLKAQDVYYKALENLKEAQFAEREKALEEKIRQEVIGTITSNIMNMGAK